MRASARSMFGSLALLGALFVALASPLRAETDDAATGAQGGATEQLRRLLTIAPNRQLGQPGNDAIDAWVKNLFEGAAKRRNASDPQAEEFRKASGESNAGIDKARLADPPDVDALKAAAVAALDSDLRAAESLKGKWQVGRIRYNSAAFVPGRAEAMIGERGPIRLYQVAPNGVEPANLPADGFSGSLVYAGKGDSADLAGADLRGAVVLMEFASDKKWIDAVQLGAKVVVFLEPEAPADATIFQAIQKRTESIIKVPRYYVTRADLVAALGENWRESLDAKPKIAISQSEPGRWVTRECFADWLFIPGVEPLKPWDTSIEEDLGRQLVHIQAFKDSQSIVPELAPGATSAANLVLLASLIERFEKNPPRRPVLVSAVNAHTNGMLGEEEFAYAAFAKPEAISTELNAIERELIRQRFIRDFYSQTPTGELTHAMRTDSRTIGGQVLNVKDPAVDRLVSLRNSMREERNDLQYELIEVARQRRAGEAVKLTPAQEEEQKTRIRALDHASDDIVDLQRLFNRFGSQISFEGLEADQRARVVEVFEHVRKQAQVNVTRLESNRARLFENLDIRRRLLWLTASSSETAPKDGVAAQARRWRPLPAIMAMTLDLAFDTDRVGWFHTGTFRSSDDAVANEDRERVQRLAIYTLKTAEDLARAAGSTNLLDNTIRGAKGLSWDAHVGSVVAFAAPVMHSYQVPALTLASTRDSRRREFTPFDTIERLNLDNFESIFRFSRDYIPLLINGDDLSGTRVVRGTQSPLTVDVSVRRHDQFAVSVPKQVLPGAVVMAAPNVKGLLPVHGAMLGQVRVYPIQIADDRGGTTFHGSVLRNGTAFVFGYDESFRKLRYALDLGAGETRLDSSFGAAATNPYLGKQLIVAEFDKVDLIGLSQPMSLMPGAGIEIIDAQQEALPRNFSAYGIKPGGVKKGIPYSGDGTGSIMVKPGSRFKLKVDAGLAINADAKAPQGRGYPSDIGMLNNLVLTGARDMWQLTEQRLDLLTSKGVKNDTALRFNAEAGKLIEAADAAGNAGANDRVNVLAEQSRGFAYQGYTRALATINDLIKAVVIFLALVIPFCFFVTKLITPYTDVNRQLILFLCVFVGMAFTLRLLHPAFEIAKTPEVVILAFVILGLAGFVAMVLVGRFNSTMTQAIEESLQAESVDAPQSRLAGVAFLVGVNNMKRRRIRTTLTCATVILVTFTMLSVISVGQDVEPAKIRLSADTQYSGFLFANPGLTPINSVQLRRLQAQFANRVHGKAPNAVRSETVVRAWAQRLGGSGEYLAYELTPAKPIAGATMASVETKVLVGLETREDGFLTKMPLLAGGRWFSSDNAAEIILSRDTAAFLGITPENFTGQEILVAGRRLRLVGLLDDAAIEAVRDLADVPLLPLLTPPTQKLSLTNDGSGAQTSLDPSASLTSIPGVQMARSKDVAFVPIETARSTGEAGDRVLAVKYQPVTQESDADATAALDGKTAREIDEARLSAASKAAWDDANSLIQFQYARVSVGLSRTAAQGNDAAGRGIDPGQYTLASSSSTEVGGLVKIAIPIILAATIILNTMLGSVMERRREVAIYNAIGLNPGHVMMFFLAESLVFGLVGSVAGYLIGQGLSLVITRFINLNLNYSSLSVMVVIFLTIATVLLSTVYPAMMAARAAVPSGQRRWSLPQPEGDQIHIHFPFSYDGARVFGVCAYLRDFMRQNSEASTGKFLAKLGPVGRVKNAAESANPAESLSYCMLFDIAPAPYDLGVNQKMEVYAYYDRRVRAHMLSVHLTRVSGERGNWLAVNQPFLEALRKRLLGWRSQRPETHKQFHKIGEEMFAVAPELPVMGASGRNGKSSADGASDTNANAAAKSGVNQREQA